MEQKNGLRISRRAIVDYLWIIVGSLIAGTGIAVFTTPAKIAGGGVNGIATILYHTLGFEPGMAMLAMNIAQALWTTAAGPCVAIPAISFYTFFKNRATNIILGMEALTMDLIKSLRNVEVVEE